MKITKAQDREMIANFAKTVAITRLATVRKNVKTFKTSPSCTSLQKKSK